MFMILTEGADAGATIMIPTYLAKSRSRRYLKAVLDHYDQTMKYDDFVKAALQLKTFANVADNPVISVRFSHVA